jgi:2-polyprenyl-6-methoxyphenol hydroxylase-like FAD-dependent oxidoreductase
MTALRRAIVIGGSMAGLFAALALQRRGWVVDVYERNAVPLEGRGAGIVTHRRLAAALAEVGLALPDMIGVPIPERRLYGRDGALLRSLDMVQTNTSWDGLLRVLRRAFADSRYHLGHGLISLEATAEGALARFANGRTVEADLVVAADGFRSTVREILLPAIQPAYAGYVAWRGLVDEAALSPTAHRALMGCFAFCLPAGEQMLGYPVAGGDGAPGTGALRYNFVWYRPARTAGALERLLTDRNGTRHALSVPPPLVDTAVIAEMRAAAEAVLAPAFADAVRATPMPFLQPIYDLEVPAMARGRIVLIGDAAFVARPHVGGGVTKAAEDAIALAGALDDTDLNRGLAAFAAARQAAGRRMVAQGRALGAALDDPRTNESGDIDVLRDTASLAFLDQPST